MRTIYSILILLWIFLTVVCVLDVIVCMISMCALPHTRWIRCPEYTHKWWCCWGSRSEVFWRRSIGPPRHPVGHLDEKERRHDQARGARTSKRLRKRYDRGSPRTNAVQPKLPRGRKPFLRWTCAHHPAQKCIKTQRQTHIYTNAYMKTIQANS